MKFQDYFSQWLLRIFLPGMKKDRTHFKKSIQKASKVLISCPRDMKKGHTEKAVSGLAGLFPRQGVILLYPGFKEDESSGSEKKISSTPVLIPNLKRQSLWMLMRSAELRALSRRSFDLFLDLDPEFNLMNCYLSRSLKAPVRITFQKPYSQSFYNLVYQPTRGSEYGKQLEGLLKFLKAFI